MSCDAMIGTDEHPGRTRGIINAKRHKAFNRSTQHSERLGRSEHAIRFVARCYHCARLGRLDARKRWFWSCSRPVFRDDDVSKVQSTRPTDAFEAGLFESFIGPAKTEPAKRHRVEGQ